MPSRPARVYPSRLPRDPVPTGYDGLPAARWRDPRIAAAYADRDDALERAVVWPELAEAVRPAQQRRGPGRPDGVVLDLGSGTGAFGHLLARTAWLRVHAVETSPTLHRIGAERMRDAWLKRCMPDARGRLTLRPAQCTAAVASLVLTHMPHAAHIIGALSEVRRVLRPGSPLALVEPGAFGPTRGDATVQWGGRADDADGTPGRGEAVCEVSEGQPFPAHYRLRDGGTLTVTAWRYSPGTLAECLRKTGFELRELRLLGAASPGAPAPYLLLLCRAM